jgi:hypothetical protein
MSFPISGIKRSPPVTAAASGLALLLFPTPGLGRRGFYVRNPDTTNSLYIYLRSGPHAPPTVGGSGANDDIDYSVPAGTTFEFIGDETVIAYVGSSASTIVVTPKEVFGTKS